MLLKNCCLILTVQKIHAEVKKMPVSINEFLIKTSKSLTRSKLTASRLIDYIGNTHQKLSR